MGAARGLEKTTWPCEPTSLPASTPSIADPRPRVDASREIHSQAARRQQWPFHRRVWWSIRGSDLVVQAVGIGIVQAHVRTLSVPQPRVFDRDDGMRRHASCQPGGGADHRVVADSRLAAQERRVGVDDDFVLDGRVPLVSAEDFAGRFITRKTERTECHALVDLHTVADLGRLADHHAGAVVDEKAVADAGAPGECRCRSCRGRTRSSSGE